MAGTREGARKRLEGRRHAPPAIRCSVWRPGGRHDGHDCREPGAVAFAARCGCGHAIEGDICAVCRLSQDLRCLTCWKEPGSEHKCPVRFLEGATS
jgi:hypothetical protein